MAYNVSDQYFEQTTDTNGNFANSVAGQNNSFFLPAVYSKKVLNFFRKSSVAEAITNTDYAGEITAFGDTVRIIKEPVITVYQYERGADVTSTKLTDQEVSLVVDTANAFKFIVDDIETSMSHVNFKEVASSSAAYALRDAFDEGVIAAMFAGVSAATPNHILGSDNATDLAAGTFVIHQVLVILYAASMYMVLKYSVQKPSFRLSTVSTKNNRGMKYSPFLFWR
jgi:hypothetical protein